jgi:hypothetical protein
MAWQKRSIYQLCVCVWWLMFPVTLVISQATGPLMAIFSPARFLFTRP